MLRRAALLSACATRVLPVWEQAFPADDRPRRLIGLVGAVLRGEAPEDELKARTEELRTDVDPMGADPTLLRPFYAGIAAVHLSYDARDGDLDPDFYDEDDEDDDLDEPPVEALGALATAPDDPDAHRTWWRWSVTEAFPAASAAAP